MRLNKFLTRAGHCSRRKAEELIKQGRVRVNGQKATITTPVSHEDKVEVDGQKIEFAWSQNPRKTYAFHKPRGVVCTLSSKERPNLQDCFPLEGHFFPVGRLDKDSEGLLLITTDGQLSLELTHPRFEKFKRYEVVLKSEYDENFLRKMAGGVRIDGYKTQDCVVEPLSLKKFSIWLKEGKNRQIRKMCEELGYEVMILRRTHCGSFALDLPSGAYRELSDEEINLLKKDPDDFEKV